MGSFLSDTVFVGTSLWTRNQLPFKYKPEQTADAKISHKELNRQTAEALKQLLGNVDLFRPPVLRR